MRINARILLPGLLVPGGGYFALRAWRQGFAFLAIGLLVAALWTNLFTEFRYSVLLFWGVLCLASVLGADEVSRSSLGQGLGIAWIINGAAIFVAAGLGVGALLSNAGVFVTPDGLLDVRLARKLLVAGELTAYALGGVVLGAFAARPVRVALWGAVLAIGWSFARGVSEIGVEAAVSVARARWPQLAFLYGASLLVAAFSAFFARVVLRGLSRADSRRPTAAPASAPGPQGS